MYHRSMLIIAAAIFALLLVCVQKDSRIGRVNPLDNGNNNSSGPTTDSLVAYFPFNGGAVDESGNGLHVSVNGATLTSDRFGNADRAYLFSGTSQYIAVSDTSLISFARTQSFTVSLWLKTASAKTDMFPLMKYVYGMSSGYYFIINHPAGVNNTCTGAGIPGFFVGLGTPACSASPINDDAWHLIVGSYAGTDSSVTLSIDGVAQATTGAKGLYDVVAAAPLIIGGSPNAIAFAGSLDDIRIYNRILTQNEILGLFHEGGWTGK